MSSETNRILIDRFSVHGNIDIWKTKHRYFLISTIEMSYRTIFSIQFVCDFLFSIDSSIPCIQKKMHLYYLKKTLIFKHFEIGKNQKKIQEEKKL